MPRSGLGAYCVLHARLVQEWPGGSVGIRAGRLLCLTATTYSIRTPAWSGTVEDMSHPLFEARDLDLGRSSVLADGGYVGELVE